MSINGEDYEYWEEQKERSPSASGKKRHRDSTSKTSKAKKVEGIEAARILRVEEARRRVGQVIEGLIGKGSPEEIETALEQYTQWINACVKADSLYLDVEKDIRYDDFRSGGPGGQNVNKVNSGIRAKHIASGISARSTDSRDQYINKAEARSKLIQKLGDHLQDWRTVLTDGDNSNGPKILSKEELITLV